jgi:hypothetical protein
MTEKAPDNKPKLVSDDPISQRERTIQERYVTGEDMKEELYDNSVDVHSLSNENKSENSYCDCTLANNSEICQVCFTHRHDDDLSNASDEDSSDDDDHASVNSDESDLEVQSLKKSLQQTKDKLHKLMITAFIGDIDQIKRFLFNEGSVDFQYVLQTLPPDAKTLSNLQKAFPKMELEVSLFLALSSHQEFSDSHYQLIYDNVQMYLNHFPQHALQEIEKLSSSPTNNKFCSLPYGLITLKFEQLLLKLAPLRKAMYSMDIPIHNLVHYDPEHPYAKFYLVVLELLLEDYKVLSYAYLLPEIYHSQILEWLGLQNCISKLDSHFLNNIFESILVYFDALQKAEINSRSLEQLQEEKLSSQFTPYEKMAQKIIYLIEKIWNTPALPKSSSFLRHMDEGIFTGNHLSYFKKYPQFMKNTFANTFTVDTIRGHPFMHLSYQVESDEYYILMILKHMTRVQLTHYASLLWLQADPVPISVVNYLLEEKVLNINAFIKHMSANNKKRIKEMKGNSWAFYLLHLLYFRNDDLALDIKQFKHCCKVYLEADFSESEEDLSTEQALLCQHFKNLFLTQNLEQSNKKLQECMKLIPMFQSFYPPPFTRWLVTHYEPKLFKEFLKHQSPDNFNEYVEYLEKRETLLVQTGKIMLLKGRKNTRLPKVVAYLKPYVVDRPLPNLFVPEDIQLLSYMYYLMCILERCINCHISYSTNSKRKSNFHYQALHLEADLGDSRLKYLLSLSDLSPILTKLKYWWYEVGGIDTEKKSAIAGNNYVRREASAVNNHSHAYSGLLLGAMENSSDDDSYDSNDDDNDNDNSDANEEDDDSIDIIDEDEEDDEDDNVNIPYHVEPLSVLYFMLLICNSDAQRNHLREHIELTCEKMGRTEGWNRNLAFGLGLFFINYDYRKNDSLHYNKVLIISPYLKWLAKQSGKMNQDVGNVDISFYINFILYEYLIEYQLTVSDSELAILLSTVPQCTSKKSVTLSQSLLTSYESYPRSMQILLQKHYVHLYKKIPKHELLKLNWNMHEKKDWWSEYLALVFQTSETRLTALHVIDKIGGTPNDPNNGINREFYRYLIQNTIFTKFFEPLTEEGYRLPNQKLTPNEAWQLGVFLARFYFIDHQKFSMKLHPVHWYILGQSIHLYPSFQENLADFRAFLQPASHPEWYMQVTGCGPNSQEGCDPLRYFMPYLRAKFETYYPVLQQMASGFQSVMTLTHIFMDHFALAPETLAIYMEPELDLTLENMNQYLRVTVSRDLDAVSLKEAFMEAFFTLSQEDQQKMMINWTSQASITEFIDLQIASSIEYDAKEEKVWARTYFRAETCFKKLAVPYDTLQQLDVKLNEDPKAYLVRNIVKVLKDTIFQFDRMEEAKIRFTFT